MHVRIAALIIIIATLVLSFNSPSRSATQHKELTAKCLGNKGRMSDVVAACNTIMDSDEISETQHQNLLKSRGWAFYCGKEYELAIADYTSALTVQPNDATAFVRRAFAHDALDDQEAAASDYANALRTDPSNTYALFHKAKFEQNIGRKEAALDGYRRIIELDPTHEKAGKRLAGLLLERKDYQAALELFEGPADRWADRSWVLGHLGALHIIHTQNLTAALETVEEYQEIQPDVTEEFLRYALVHLTIGDENEGKAYVEQYIQHVLQKTSAKRSLKDRIDWLWLGPADWELVASSVRRAQTYEVFGRRDLARAAFHTYFQTAQIDGTEEMKRLLRNTGADPEAGSHQSVNDLIDYYLDHNDLKLSWLPDPKR